MAPLSLPAIRTRLRPHYIWVSGPIIIYIQFGTRPVTRRQKADTSPCTREKMDRLRTVLSIVASIAGALLTMVLVEAFREMGGQGRTGLGAVAGGLTEALLSFWFWAVAA